MENTKKENGTSRKIKKRKRNPLFIILMILLLGVMGFSGYKIVDQLLIYKRGQDAYKNLQKDVLSSIDAAAISTLATTAWDVPAQEPTVPGHQPYTRATQDPATMSTENERGDITYDPAETDAGVQQVLPLFSVNFDVLKATNPDTRAWLYGMDSIVNYPVVQGADNDYYSHRLLDGSEQFCGTLFIDCRNNFLEDDISYIYGHKMKDGSMFGHFGKYDSYAYYSTHPSFRLFLPDAIYDLQVIACVYTTDKEPLRFNFANQQDFNNTIADYRSRSTFQTAIEANYGDQLVCLWTCAYYVEGGRMFILCKAVRVA